MESTARPGDAAVVHFGREVRRRREAARMTLEQLAEASGLTPNYVGSVETGKRDPSLTTIIKLARGLRVPVGELLGGVQGLTPRALEAARLFQETSSDVQDSVVQLLRAVRRRR